MKKISVLLLMIANLMVAQNKQKPNVIVVLADDISAREMPLYKSDTWSPPTGGNTQDMNYRANTPVLDKIANDGLYVKTAWAAVVCSPSRAMMMTGRYAHLHKWWGNKTTGKYTDENGKIATYPFYASSPLNIGTVAQKGGYATMWAGKTQMRNPNLDKYGFDEGVFTPGESSQGGENPYTDFQVELKKVDGKKQVINNDTGEKATTYPQSGWYWKPHVMLMNHPSSKKTFEWWPNTKEAKKEYGLNTYGPDVELDFIFDFMERKTKEKKPFFVYHTTHLGHDAFDFFNPQTHTKWPGTPKIEWKNGKYKRTAPNVTGDKGVYNTHGTVTEPGIHNHLNYLDYQMSLYLQKLKDLKIDKNTIVIFCADNGTSGYGKNSAESQKGTHVPFIVYAPGLGLTKKGEQDVLVNLADVLPTIAEITNVNIPKDYEINGVSLWPFLTTKQKEHRDWIYGYKDGLQIIRSKSLLKDGYNKWYDVSETPSDLISFPKIKDEKKLSEVAYKEKQMLMRVLPQFNTFKTAQHGPLTTQQKKQVEKQEAIKKQKFEELKAKKRAQQKKKNKK
ncbi:sulfatase-like hydrolase/transferase [Wenyingzhuangia sp. 2_MG-2023]|uniref:sulfatase-like hydrolase/transferase n=1 Tax=Wenyingzhuangia sp. 2_MG-2023 TaxID=3062639 RepID=UPI0026E2D7FF|nr:sulfatase-like hydrolase/transferase [Wenyingzhuangia sp. 2_MG-2023]MDO6736358.1 sulfatase-like hydrolase/transferase [Wenyingzhuangia sp. 2_MG-2023]